MIEVLLGPRKYHDFQNAVLVNFLNDFDPLVHENKWCLDTGANTAPNHHGLRILPAFDNGRAVVSLGELASAVLLIIGLFQGEQLLIREKDAVPVERCMSTKKSLSSFESDSLVITRQ